jgi:hypothetical protein
MRRQEWIIGAVTLALAGSAMAGDRPSFGARDGLDVAASAARSWAEDATLVYLENDEPVGSDGEAERWGYLYYSSTRAEARAYSVRDGKVVTAENLAMTFEAPPVPPSWVDSDVALAAADEREGRRFRTEHAGEAATMLLMRGVFHADRPDAVTWLVVYRADGVPSLFVVVDASTGEVARTWRG